MENQGLQLKKAIKARGLSQEEAAAKLQMTRQNLTNYLNRSALPHDFIEKVKEDLDIDLLDQGRKRGDIDQLINSINYIVDLQKELIKVKNDTINTLTEKLSSCEKRLKEVGS